MGKALITEQHLTDIADAIRFKTDSIDKYRPEDMASAIRNMHPVMRLQSKTVIGNGTITPDDGYDGLSSVVVDIRASSGLLKMHQLGYFTNEYQGNIYDSSAITAANLVLLGDFSQTGAASGNTLADTISNYFALLLQGIYKAQRTSGYNTTMMYINPQLNMAYWAGMKDRNSSYDCLVTFTDDTHCNLSGTRQVIIYGLP